MKQVSQNYRSGAIRLRDVALPALKPGGVLVRTHYSVISAGTEGMKVREGKMSLVEKARARPDQVKKVLKTARQQGVRTAYRKAINRLETLTPLGYSLSGEVVAVGREAGEFRVGQHVACGGTGYANHAEVNFIPRNLVVAVPEGMTMEDAAFATIGSIALHATRQGAMQLGEMACVIGLGMMGLLVVQLLRAGGVHVVGIDLVEDRCALARVLGAAAAGPPEHSAVRAAVERLSGGCGADTIFLCASGSSNKPVELAVSLARDRARVVDLGKIRMDLPWKEYYEKEIDVRFSRSYGPGRYDPNYEERGIDYPVGYVRWTERRNMEAFLSLLAEKKVSVDAISSSIHPIAEAESVYNQLADGTLQGLGFIFAYPQDDAPAEAPQTPSPMHTPESKPGVRLGVIGAGNYASSMLLPYLAKDPDVSLCEVVTTTGLSAENAVRKFGFNRAGTDSEALLDREGIDAVLIATRHDTHARIVDAALRKNKAVFVEKPLAIDREGVEQVRRAVVESGNDRLQVGFNRRFAPIVIRMQEILTSRTGPLAMNYRVHAGQMEGTSWYRDSEQGSRFVGEGGHFLDLFAALCGARPVRVSAQRIHSPSATDNDLDNLSVSVQYDDGSLGSLLYLTQGGTSLPKEFLEVHGGGQTLQLQNFESLHCFTGDRRKRISAKGQDKGQRSELSAFVSSVKSGSPMPIPFDCLLDTTLATLAASESAAGGSPIDLADLWTPEG
jgi:predicted dehydrogenase/threonine dehydrogenase-like Zn-dependent dehydrogenase